MPPQWTERKEKIYTESGNNAAKKAKYYEELFQWNSSNDQLTQFLREFFYQVMPADFMTGKNQKVFNKKLKEFVAFNRFESFTR